MFSEFFITFTNLVYKFLFWIRPQNFWFTTSTRLLSFFPVSVWFSWFVQFTYQYEVCEVIWHLLLTGLLNFFARNKVQCLYENPCLLGCNIASLGKQFLIYWTVTVPSFSEFSNPRRWRHCDYLTHLKLLTKWRLTRLIFRHTAVRTLSCTTALGLLLTQHVLCTLAGNVEAIRICRNFLHNCYT